MKNEKKIGNILFNWNGNIHVDFKDNFSLQQKFILRFNSFWKHKFELLDHNKNIVLGQWGENNWSSMGYDYKIEKFGLQLNINENELLAYVGYAANLHTTMTNSAEEFLFSCRT